MKTIFSLLVAALCFMAPAYSQMSFSWSSPWKISSSSQHRLIEEKVANQAGILLEGTVSFVRHSLQSRTVRFGAAGLATIVGLCMLFSFAEKENPISASQVTARRRCLNKPKRGISVHKPSDRKRWARKVKGDNRRQVSLG